GKTLVEHAVWPKGILDLGPEVTAVNKERLMRDIVVDGRYNFTPDGKWFVWSRGRQHHIFDVATGKKRPSLPKRNSHTFEMALSADSKSILTGSQGEQTKLKLPNGEERLSGLYELY